MDRPNILIFCVDQMQKRALGCYGNKQVITPNLDALAKDSVVYNRGYCNNPVCMPSRATMFTGKTPRQHGLLTNGNLFPENNVTLMQALKQQDYTTFSVGKLHLQPFSSWKENGSPVCADQEGKANWESGKVKNLNGYLGFDKVVYVGGHGYTFGEYVNHLKDIGREDVIGLYTREKSYFRSEKQFDCYSTDIPDGLHYNDFIADKTIESIEEYKTRPFFAWCSFPDPHHPFSATRKFAQLYDPQKLEIPYDIFDDSDLLAFLQEGRKTKGGKFDEKTLREILANTYGMVSHIDFCVGRVIEKLKECGLYDNTLIMFVSDHGEYMGYHNLLYKAHWLYECMINVPFIMKKPYQTDRRVSENVVSLLDIVPTVLDYAGVSQKALDTRENYAAEIQPLIGQSLRDGEKNECAIFEYDEDWHKGHNYRVRGIVTQKYKMIFYANAEQGILLDLEKDPEESKNLFNEEEYLPVKAKLMEMYIYKFAQSDRYDTPRKCGA